MKPRTGSSGKWGHGCELRFACYALTCVMAATGLPVYPLSARNRGQRVATLPAALNAVVGNNPCYLATSAQVHKFSRARPLLIRVIQH